MWSGRELEQKVVNALDCIGKGAAALSEAGTTVFAVSNAMQKQGLSCRFNQTCGDKTYFNQTCGDKINHRIEVSLSPQRVSLFLSRPTSTRPVRY